MSTTPQAYASPMGGAGEVKRANQAVPGGRVVDVEFMRSCRPRPRRTLISATRVRPDHPPIPDTDTHLTESPHSDASGVRLCTKCLGPTIHSPGITQKPSFTRANTSKCLLLWSKTSLPHFDRFRLVLPHTRPTKWSHQMGHVEKVDRPKPWRTVYRAPDGRRHSKRPHPQD